MQADKKHNCTILDMPNDEELFDLAELFKIFGDSTRIKILVALLKNELCVAHLAQMLNLTQSATSHQLKVLKSAGLVKFKRSGKQLFYSISDLHVLNILLQGLEHIKE